MSKWRTRTRLIYIAAHVLRCMSYRANGIGCAIINVRTILNLFLKHGLGDSSGSISSLDVEERTIRV